MASAALRGCLRRLRRDRTSPPEIVTRDQREYVPACADRAPDRPADFRGSDARMIAHRNFYNAETSFGAFQNYLHSPAVRRLLQLQRIKHVDARRPEWTEISDLHAIKDSD